MKHIAYFDEYVGVDYNVNFKLQFNYDKKAYTQAVQKVAMMAVTKVYPSADH